MSIAKEFKDFIAKGNVIDLAVAVVIGAAFGQIVTSLVNNILMPLVGMALGGLDFTTLSVNVGKAHVMYGNFIQSVINFLIIAFCIFLIVKVMNKIMKQKAAAPQAVADADLAKVENTEVGLLKEIRDLLKK